MREVSLCSLETHFNSHVSASQPLWLQGILQACVDLLNLFCVTFFFAQTPSLEIVAEKGPLCHFSAGDSRVFFFLPPKKSQVQPLGQVSMPV